MPVGISRTFSSPFYSGTATTGGVSALVPAKFNCALAGHVFMFDSRFEDWGERSIARLRNQADGARVMSERSLNPEGLWPMSAESWHKGAGQRFFDRDDSDPARYFTSKGVDPWTKGQIGLLPATDQKRSSANSNLALAATGSRLYLIDGNTLASTTDVTVDTPTFTPSTTGGTALSSPVSITSDGTRVWVADGTDVYYSDAATTYATYMGAPTPGDVVRYVNGRLLLGNDNVWSEIVGTAGAATLDNVYTHRNADFDWVDFCAGPTHIYGAGFSGDKSLIYRSSIVADATGLSEPTVAIELPDGEIVRSISSYLGRVLLIGTDKGLRIALIGDSGELTLGKLITTTAAVRCFEGQDRFVWFGWTNYDGTSTGLGRLDLSVFNDDVPAYASDLMVTGSGVVNSVVTFQSRRVFAVNGLGFYAEDTSKVASGEIVSGGFTYSLTEPKTALFLDSQHAAGAGAFQAALQVDDGTYVDVGATVTTSNSAGDVSVTVSQKRGRTFQIRYTLTRDPGDATLGPVLVRWTLRAQQAATPGIKKVVPLLLHDNVMTANGDTHTVDIARERGFLKSLHRTGQVFLYQEGEEGTVVFMDDFQWVPYHPSEHVPWSANGTFLAVLKEVG